MRQIGKLPSKSSAEVLADYLLTQGITTKLEQSPGSGEGSEQWIVWGLNEDQLEQSREIFKRYEANPDDVSFHEARKTARTLKKQEQAEKARRERQMFDANRMWSAPRLKDIPVVTTCIAISVLLGLVTGFGKNRPSVQDPFFYRPQTQEDMGLDQAGEAQIDEEFFEGDGSSLLDTGMLRKIKERILFARKAPRERPKIPEEAILRGQVWRLVTPMFLHFGTLHLLFNMMWLYNLGGVIEVRRGSWHLLGLILVISAVSNMAQAHSSPNLFGGMSGVVYGLFVYLWLGRVVDPGIGFGVSQQQVVLMGVWLVMGFNMESMNMANWAHLAGAITGGVLVLLRTEVRKLRS